MKERRDSPGRCCMAWRSVSFPGRVGTVKVGREVMAQLWPGVEGSLRQVHEPRLGHTGQGHREVVGHDGLISSCREDKGGVDLQELYEVDSPIVLLQQM
jgi:hypothetical protein